jgi:hypothetical protein
MTDDEVNATLTGLSDTFGGSLARHYNLHEPLPAAGPSARPEAPGQAISGPKAPSRTPRRWRHRLKRLNRKALRMKENGLENRICHNQPLKGPRSRAESDTRSSANKVRQH